MAQLTLKGPFETKPLKKQTIMNAAGDKTDTKKTWSLFYHPSPIISRSYICRT